MDPLIVGLDVGTTSVKAVVYEPDGSAAAVATIPTPTHHPRPGRAFYRADELWDCVVAVLREAVARVDDPRRIVGVAVASMGEAGVLLDADGRPTCDVIAWFDTRTTPQAEWLDRAIGKDRLFASSGISLQPIFSLAKLLWLKEHEPAAWARSVRWLHVADFIAFRLCGVAATDYSIASRTLMLDLHRLRWDDEVLREAGVDPALLAPLVSGGTALGPVTAEAAAATGLPTSATVAAGGHDHVCGAFAAGAIAPGVMLNSLGTAEAVFVPLAKPLSDPQVGREGYAQGAHVVDGRSYVFAGQYTSGASVSWWRDVLSGPGGKLDWETMLAEAAAVPPGSLGVTFLPHLRLANPPHDDPRSRGTFVGLSTDATRGVMTRAVLEGIAFESRNSLDGIVRYPGVEVPREIRAIGGGTRNDLLMAIKASIVRQPHTVLGLQEGTALGAAMLGGLAAGVYADSVSAIAALADSARTVEPDPAAEPVYEEVYQRVFRPLYDAVAPVSHAIVRLQGEWAPS